MENPVARLSQVILQSAINLTKGCEAQGLNISSLDDIQSTGASPMFDEKMVIDAANIMAAAQELLAILNPPELYVFNIAQGSVRTAGLRAAIHLHVAEILREGGPKGVHVDEIARIVKVDSSKLIRILRLLTSNYIFHEIEPNVFANNRLSCVLDSGQSVSVLVSSPETKYDRKESTVLAHIDYLTDHPAKASAYLSERLKDPTSPVLPEVIRRLEKKVDLPDWQVEEITDPYRTRNFVRRSIGSDALSQYGFDVFGQVQTFKEAKPDAKVVAIGLESGQLVCDLSRTLPDLNFVIYDFSEQIKDSKMLWQMWDADPDQVKSGRLQLEANVSTLKNSAIFVIPFLPLLSDEYLVKKLTELRNAANKDTSLVIGSWDFSDSEECADSTAILNELACTFDLSYLAWSNGRMRPFEDVKELLKKSGWTVDEVYCRLVWMAVQARPV